MSESGKTWHIIIHRRPEKILQRLPQDLVQRIWKAILALSTNPLPPGCKKMAGHANLNRIRVGEWRIIYAIEENELIILVLDIATRGKAYQYY